MRFDDVLADFRGKIGDMRAEVARRRAVTALDPVADTTEYWADWLEAGLADLARKMETLTPTQYAKLHGGAPATVRRWCERGELPGAQKDATGEWRIPRAAVRQYARRTKTQAA